MQDCICISVDKTIKPKTEQQNQDNKDNSVNRNEKRGFSAIPVFKDPLLKNHSIARHVLKKSAAQIIPPPSATSTYSHGSKRSYNGATEQPIFNRFGFKLRQPLAETRKNQENQ